MTDAAPEGAPSLPPPRLARSPVTRAFLLGLGTIAVGLGSIGIFVRGLPTVPFLLLAAWCYGRSSARLYRWIYGHRLFGPILLDWEQERSLSMRTKRLGVLSVWIGMFASVTAFHFAAAANLYPYLAAMMLLVATGVTLFLMTRRTSVPRGLEETAQAAARRAALRESKRFGITVLIFGSLGAAVFHRVVAPQAGAVFLVPFVLLVGIGAALWLVVWSGRHQTGRGAIPPEPRVEKPT